MINTPTSSRWLALSILAVISTVLSTSAFQSTPQSHYHYRHRNHCTLLSKRTDEEVSRLKQSAERLRAEALKAQEQLGQRRAAVATTVEVREVVEYDAVADSCWEITYRFADEPISKSNEEQKPRTFYTGKVTLHFKPDGYTDMIPDVQSSETTKPRSATQATDPAAIPSDTKAVKFQKVWGWDIETSNQDSCEYLLFSADLQLPALPSGITPMPERYYFQIRVDNRSSSKSNDRTGGNDKGKIVLEDGSVTVKRDLNTGGGWWGLFQTEGILAEFREVGLFRCRAVARPSG